MSTAALAHVSHSLTSSERSVAPIERPQAVYSAAEALDFTADEHAFFAAGDALALAADEPDSFDDLDASPRSGPRRR